MSVIEELPRSRDRFDLVAVARWVLVAVIGLGTLLVWWTTPRTSTVEQLSVDLQAGKVSWLDTDCNPEGGDGLVGFTVVSRPDFIEGVRNGLENGNRDVCWRTSWGRAYAADADELHQYFRRTLRQEFDGTSPSDPLSLTLRQSAVDLSPGDAPEVVESFSDGTTPLRQWTSGIVGVCVVGLIVLMIAWQQPRRGTRWGWFWVMITASGLGTIVYLLREAPWNRAATAMPQPAARQTRVPVPDGTTRDRFSGILGFVIALLVSLALSATIQFVDGDGPDLGTQDVRWSVVGPDGEVTHIVWSSAD